jgi:hypothetical protein
MAKMKFTNISLGIAFALAVMTGIAVAHEECQDNYYWSAASKACVERPDAACGGATAICRDHKCSHSRHRGGTCSSHGGVEKWLIQQGE